MSEIQFENRYVLTKETLLEYMNIFTFTNPIFLVILSVGLLGILLKIESVFASGFDGYMLFNSIAPVIGSLLIITGAFYLRNRSACKAQILREAEMYHGEREILLQIGNGITAINEKIGASQHFDFSLISKYKKTKNLVILITKAKTTLIFRKDSFTIGTYEEFINYLNICYPYFRLKP